MNRALAACALVATLTVLAACGANANQPEAAPATSPSSSPTDTATPSPTEPPTAADTPTPSTSTAATPSSTGGQPDFSKMCPTVVTRAGIPTCTVLHPTKPYLRLPADPTGANGGILGGFNDEGQFVSSATGKTYKMDPGSNPVYSYAAKDAAWDNVIYRAVLRNGAVASVTKVAQVTEEAALNRLFAGKTLEGQMDVWVPDKSSSEGGQWSGNTTAKTKVPIRVQLATSASNGVLNGSILNATRSVKSSTGNCLPSLASQGTANPLFDGRTASFYLTRTTGMHNPGETMVVLTFKPGVGQGMASGVSNHIGSIPLLFGRYSLIQIGDVADHAGSRSDGPSWWGLKTVKGGGGAC